MQLLCLFSISPHFPRYFSLLPLHFFFPLLHLCRLLFILSHPNVWPRSSFNALSKQLSNLEENQEHRRRSRKKILVEKNQARSRLMVIILGRKPRLILEEMLSDLLCCDRDENGKKNQDKLGKNLIDLLLWKINAMQQNSAYFLKCRFQNFLGR